MEEESYLKSLVGDYLTSVSPNLAKKFKNGNKVKPLPAGSPTLLELVKEHQKNSPIKRKLNMSNGHTPAKKAKKDESSSDEESDEDSEDSGLQVKAPAKPAAEPMEEDSSDDSESEEEEEKAKPAAKKAPAKKEESSSDDSDSSDEEEEKAKPAAKPAAKAPAKKEESSSDDSDSDDEEEEAKPAPKKAEAKKTPAKKEESSSDDSSDDEEEEKIAAKAKAATPAKKTPAKKEESSSDDDSSDDEEEEKPAAKAATPAKKAPAKKEESSSDEDSSDDDEEEEKPAPKAKKTPAKKEESSDDDDSSDDDEEEEDEKPAKAKKEPEPEAEPELVIKNNKNKKTPQKSINGQAGQIEGKKIFVHNVSEEATYEDFQKEVEKYGEVTDFFNPGRGFAFIEFSTNEEANACIAGMDNTEVAGRTIQMNIAKPKGEKPDRRDSQGGGRGGHNKSWNEQPAGSKIFVHNVSEEATYEDFQKEVEKHGEVTDFFNPGRGFAFVEFSTNEQANACIAAMDNTEIAGRTIQMNIARPKGEKGGDRRDSRGGGRGGRGGAGGGGGRRNDVEGTKLFVHNVSEETSQDDLRSAFEASGTVTDAYNTGKGFAFITYSSPAEAQAAIQAMNGTHVCGRDIECNIAKPRGESGGGRGGRGGGGRGGARGGRGGGGFGRGANSISIGSGGTGANKKKTFD